MNENNRFSFEQSGRLVLTLAQRLRLYYQLECLTGIHLLVAAISISQSPLYKRLLELGIEKDQISQICSDMLQETYLAYSTQKTFCVIDLTSNVFALSEEAFSILNTADNIAKNYYSKNYIGCNEIISACCECLPVLYECFLKKAGIYPAPNNLQKEDITMKIPVGLSGCLTVLNSKFSPNESECTILGREKETMSLLRILAKAKKRNAVLIGEPGVGKTAIVEKFTWLIVTGNCPSKFKDYSVVSLDVNSIIANTQFRGSAEARFNALIGFLEDNPKCILFIDEIHTLLGAGACREGDLDLANALKPILARSSTQVIGATTSDEYTKYFSKDGALKRRFEKIDVKEPKIAEVLPMIRNQIKWLSSVHNVTISDEIVHMIIFYASCFNKETKNPDRTLDLLDRAMATAELAGKDAVDRNDVLDNFSVNNEILNNTPENVKIALAAHEAGHFLVHHFSSELSNFKTTALSIMPAEDYYGAHVYEIDNNVMPSRTLNYYIQYIACSLGGRIAEKLFSSELSAGASADLKKATDLAKVVVTQYALVDTFSDKRVYLNDKDSAPLIKENVYRIDNEIDNILNKAEMYAKYIFKHHRKELNLLVDTLLEKKMMSAEELDELFTK